MVESVLQTAQISCRGGLDLRSTTQDLLALPGNAVVLTNFEQSIAGGYRRIDGFTKVTTTTLPDAGTIEGVKLYNNGYVMCRGDDIYFSFNGDDWKQVNRNSPTLVNETTFDALAVLPRTGATTYTFDTFTQGAATGRIDLLIHSDLGKPAVLTIIGTTLATATYRYVEIASGGLVDMAFGVVHNDQHIVAGDPNNPSTVYVSAITDMEDFIGSLSSNFSVADPVVGIRSHRDALFIFCENSIWKATEINSGTPNVQPVTRNVGCVSGATIQEIGGDLMFLAPDGLRTLGATDRIDDIQLSTVSGIIQERIQKILNKKDLYTFTSVVLKNKNQYRLFWNDPALPPTSQEGLTAVFFPDQETGQEWVFTDLKGIQVRAIDNGVRNGLEDTIHGNTAGMLFTHDSGKTFDGVIINEKFQTPFFDLGDSGIRKNLHDLIMYLKPEGDMDSLSVILKFDFEDTALTHQPLEYILANIPTPAIYGTAKYATAIYGAFQLPSPKIDQQGSGFTMAYVFQNTGSSDPYTIQGFTLDFMPSGRI